MITATADSWADPTPLRRVRGVRPFPVNALPRDLANMVAAVSEFTQTPTDLAGTVVLGVLSACAGGRAVVEVRPGWREPVNIYAVVAMAPGSRKSPVFATMTAPLLDVEKDLIDQVRGAIVEAETLKKIATNRAETTRAAAGRADPGQRDQLAADAIADALAAEAVTVPVLPRLFADSVTPEAAASLLAEQGGRLAILSAEGGIFDVLAGRYSNGLPDLDVWLKGHAGDPLRIDRKGRPAEYVRAPALTVCLTVQPSILTTIGRNTTFTGRGLLARFLFAVPVNNVGHRRVGTASVPAAVAEAYDTTVRSLAETMSGWTDPAVLTLTPAAAQMVLTAESTIEPRLGPHGDLGHVADWGAKLVGATVRLAALLHLAADPTRGWSTPISDSDVTGAVRLAGYFTDHAVAAFAFMGADQAVADAEHVLGHLRAHNVRAVSVRNLFDRVRSSRFEKVGDLIATLDLLETYGWVSRRPTPPRESGGRPPSPTYDVHPQVHSAQPAQPAKPFEFQGSAGSAGSAGHP